MPGRMKTRKKRCKITKNLCMLVKNSNFVRLFREGSIKSGAKNAQPPGGETNNCNIKCTQL